METTTWKYSAIALPEQVTLGYSKGHRHVSEGRIALPARSATKAGSSPAKCMHTTNGGYRPQAKALDGKQASRKAGACCDYARTASDSCSISHVDANVQDSPSVSQILADGAPAA